MGRFYQEYNGFIFEFNSIGEFFKAVLWRIFGKIVGVAIIVLIVYLLMNYGNS